MILINSVEINIRELGKKIISVLNVYETEILYFFPNNLSYIFYISYEILFYFLFDVFRHRHYFPFEILQMPIPIYLRIWPFDTSMKLNMIWKYSLYFDQFQLLTIYINARFIEYSQYTQRSSLNLVNQNQSRSIVIIFR